MFERDDLAVAVSGDTVAWFWACLRDPFQLVGQVASGLPARVGVLREAFPNDPVECRRHSRLRRRDRRWVSLEDRRNQAGVTVSCEGLRARGHLVDDGAERKDVRSRIGVLSFQLFGRHVLPRAENRSFRGQWLLLQCRTRLRSSSVTTGGPRLEFGQTKVEELHARPGDHDVARLQIAMHDAAAMGLAQRFGDLDRVAQDFFGRSGRSFARRCASRSASDSPSRYSMTRKSMPLC